MPILLLFVLGLNLIYGRKRSSEERAVPFSAFSRIYLSRDKCARAKNPLRACVLFLRADEIFLHWLFAFCCKLSFHSKPAAAFAWH
jgi:hypothetical protein